MKIRGSVQCSDGSGGGRGAPPFELVLIQPNGSKVKHIIVLKGLQLGGS